MLPCPAFMWVLGIKQTQVIILIWKTFCQLNSLSMSSLLWFCFVLKLLSFYRQVCIVNFVKHGKEMYRAESRSEDLLSFIHMNISTPFVYLIQCWRLGRPRQIGTTRAVPINTGRTVRPTPPLLGKKWGNQNQH